MRVEGAAAAGYGTHVALGSTCAAVVALRRSPASHHPASAAPGAPANSPQALQALEARSVAALPDGVRVELEGIQEGGGLGHLQDLAEQIKVRWGAFCLCAAHSCCQPPATPLSAAIRQPAPATHGTPGRSCGARAWRSWMALRPTWMPRPRRMRSCGALAGSVQAAAPAWPDLPVMWLVGREPPRLLHQACAQRLVLPASAGRTTARAGAAPPPTSSPRPCATSSAATAATCCRWVAPGCRAAWPPRWPLHSAVL